MDKLFINTFSSVDKLINKDEIELLHNQHKKINDIMMLINNTNHLIYKINNCLKYLSMSIFITNTIFLSYIFYSYYYLQQKHMTYNINI
jgi:hypothetical protein